ncbi:hypothetical protein MNBD_PLANCTO03-1513, partial [hydrothermal vent metagenome]
MRHLPAALLTTLLLCCLPLGATEPLDGVRSPCDGVILPLDTGAGPFQAPGLVFSPQPDTTQPEPAARLHPGVQLGRRAGMTLAARGVIPTVVLVPDPASYAEAIAGWTPSTIYPVLIDDGSWKTREDIARFVRSFKPESVVRWQFDPATSASAPPTEMRPRRAIRGARALAESALARAWGLEAQTPDDEPLHHRLVAHWLDNSLAPPGLIVADERDPAWTAALALAAARAQPILWTTLPKLSVDSSISPAQAEAVCAQIEQFATQSRLPWRALGDAIDAVTIAAALPGRIETQPKEFIATTDRIGRHPDAGRWAWAGQIFGSEPRAAYRAMCSIFLRIESAWLFDGYDSTQPWVQWDCTRAAEYLKKADIFTMLDDEPNNRLRDWKLRAERPIHADLILINSSGNRAWFDLAGSRARAGDIPLLDVPAAMHIVHSWSAVSPGRPATVAGRWLEHGVFAYIGSVHEPYLQAFVPTPIFAQRLLGGMAFGAAGRGDSSKVWRITVLADPLYAYRPVSPRQEIDLPLEGTISLEEELKEAAGAGRYAEMFAALSLLGRDSATARLFGAMLRDAPQSLDAGVAEAALFALFRTGTDEAFLHAYTVLPEDLAGDLHAVDALWFVGRRAVRERSDYHEAALTLMAAHIREVQKEAD